MKNIINKVKFKFLLIVITISQLIGCGLSNDSWRNSPNEQTKVETIKPGLGALYTSLLVAAQPLCKRKSCDYPLKIIKSKKINAFTDAKKVYITTGMLAFANTNEELAVVLSHELAHSVMEHISSKQKNRLLGVILDLAAAAGGVNTEGVFSDIAGQVYSQKFELEADYVGLYIMARAGYSVDNAAYFWRKMAQKFPNSVDDNIMSTHPGTAERFIILEKTAKEINAKKRNKQELLPEFQQKK